MSATWKMWRNRVKSARDFLINGKIASNVTGWNPLVWVCVIGQFLLDVLMFPQRIVRQMFTMNPGLTFFMAVFFILAAMFGSIEIKVETDETEVTQVESTGNMNMRDIATPEHIAATSAAQTYRSCFDERVLKFYQEFPKNNSITNGHVARWKRMCDNDVATARSNEARLAQEEQVKKLLNTLPTK